MYELFDVAKLLSVRKEYRQTDPESDTSPQKVCIKNYAWREEGEICMLALYCSNNYLLLRYKTANKSPEIKQIPWPGEKTIISMCFDPTVVWLLVITDTPDIYIIPALCLLEPKAKVNQLWATNDATQITLNKPTGLVTKVCWWHTLEDDQIAIYGTKDGEIVLIDLLRRRMVAFTSINGQVIDLDLIQDDQQMTTVLLITSNSGNQWKLLLESRSQQNWRPMSETTVFGSESRLPSITNIMMKSDELRGMFTPVKFTQFDRSVILYPQNAKGRHFVTAHCDKTSTFQVFDSHLEHSPFFIYKLPFGTYNVIFTDSVIFAISSIHGQRLLVLSNQKAEISSEDQQEFNKDAILQKFELPQGEKVLGTQKKSFPFYWHEKAEAEVVDNKKDNSVLSLDSIPISSHTVLDGCIIVTNSSVFECRPRISPERLFLKLAVENDDASISESLGISVGLNLSNLFEMAADHLLALNDTTQALCLYKLSKCSYVKRVTSILKHKHYSTAMEMLQKVLSSNHIVLSTSDRKQLSNLALKCYIHEIYSCVDKPSQLIEPFRNFLLGSFTFDEKLALNLLAKFGFMELLLDFAKARGLVMEGLYLLQDYGRYDIPLVLLEDLISRGFQAHLFKAGEGSYLQCLSSEDLVKLLLVKPQLAIRNVALLEPVVRSLSLESLLKLADVFDPSKPLMQGFLRRSSRHRQRTASLTSMTSYSGESIDLAAENIILKENTELDTSQLVEFFLKLVLLINIDRNTKEKPELYQQEILHNWDFDYVELKESISNEKKPKLALQPSLIGAGPEHGASIRNGDLYTWGLTRDGRLGHGDLVGKNSICPPSRVETLHMLQIKVTSVSCGGKHTVVLTQQGVYGWGSSVYGQVGVGTRHTYTRPMLLQTLLNIGESVIAVDCGQYHTLALTDSGCVYSWGWGVHGQLGHGDPEDQLIPKNIDSLSDLGVVRISAGYCHSLFLTAKGDVYSCGCAYFGQLGIGDNSKRTTPVKIVRLPEVIIAISTRYFHSVALTANNRVYSWGCHPYSLRFSAHNMRRARQQGQPMMDPIESFLSPVIIDTSFVNGKLVQVACGSFHTVALTTDGEVYVWGRNVDGQLGIGHKIEERIPVMLTKLNDKEFISIRCGGEYSIAVDSDSQVWVWGRNETGQLGLSVSNEKPLSKRPSRKQGSSSAHAQITPIVLASLPSHDASGLAPGQQGLFASTDSSCSDLYISDYYGEDCELYQLPDLSLIGNSLYSSKVIPVVFKHLTSYCHSVNILRQAIDSGEWLTAADINILNHNYSQALFCHLKMLSTSVDLSSEELCDMSENIVEKYFNVIMDDKLRISVQDKDLHFMCLEVIEFWSKHKLAVVKLEEIFLNHLSSLSSSLSLILFRSEDSGHENSVKFSTNFNLKVLENLISVDPDHPNSMNQRLTKWRNLINLDPSEGEVEIPELQSVDKLIPYDRLWSDTIQNLQKHLGDRVAISVSRSELDYLNQSDLPLATESNSAIFFTCGHHQAKKLFFDDVLKNFERELTSGSIKIPYSANLLTQYYKRQGRIPMSCPKCVLNAIWTIS